MKRFPALSFQMSTWNYYVIKMNAQDLSENIKFAYEVHEDRTLDQAIQRVLRGDRVKKEIIPYLQNQPDRFFSSIVIAALEGDPKFHPQNDMFGYLEFDGTQTYYALDGQHRLSAVKMLMNESSLDTPKGFEYDEFAVIVVVPKSGESREDFMKKYRKLFSTLNRYAKKTDGATNIILDEDDTFAILTRRLIMDHEFFLWTGPYRESEKIKTTGGKTLQTGVPFFTTIETLYEMNTLLLSSRTRVQSKWGSIDSKSMKNFRQVRPSESYIDALYDELEIYWDALLTELPVLRQDPKRMRYHEITERDRYQGNDHLLFWPIGQRLLAEIARKLIDARSHDPEHPTPESVRFALQGLSKVEWALHRAPWQYLLITREPTGRSKTLKWKMRTGGRERKEVERCAYNILSWLLNLRGTSSGLKDQWESYLIPTPPDEMIDDFWQQVKDNKQFINS